MTRSPYTHSSAQNFFGCAGRDGPCFTSRRSRKIDPHPATPFRPRLAQLFEEEQFGGSELYLKHFAGVKKKYPYIGELFDELKAEARSEDPNAARLERIDSATTAVQSKVAEWSREFQTLKNYAIFIAVMLALSYWFKK